MTHDAQRLAQECARTMLEGDEASRSLGIELTSVAPGAAEATMTVRSDMVNGWQIAHGGLITALADTAFAVACNTYGQVTVAAGLDIAFLEPGRLGDALVARAVERSRRGRSGLYDVTVSRAIDGAVLAEMRGRSRSTGRSITDDSGGSGV